jgi:hypothetical protein
MLVRKSARAAAPGRANDSQRDDLLRLQDRAEATLTSPCLQSDSYGRSRCTNVSNIVEQLALPARRGK